MLQLPKLSSKLQVQTHVQSTDPIKPTENLAESDTEVWRAHPYLGTVAQSLNVLLTSLSLLSHVL